MDFKDINTVQDLIDENDKSKEKSIEELGEYYKQIIDCVFAEGPEFGIALSQKILLSLCSYCATQAEQADNTDDCMFNSIAGTKFGSAYKLIKDIEI